MNWESEDSGEFDSFDNSGSDDSWNDDSDGYSANDNDDEHDTIRCPNCDRLFYDDAPQCPYCGEYVIHDSSLWSGKSPGVKAFYQFVAIVLIIALLGSSLILVWQWITQLFG